MRLPTFGTLLTQGACAWLCQAIATYFPVVIRGLKVLRSVVNVLQLVSKPEVLPTIWGLPFVVYLQGMLGAVEIAEMIRRRWFVRRIQSGGITPRRKSKRWHKRARR